MIYVDILKIKAKLPFLRMIFFLWKLDRETSVDYNLTWIY